MQTANVDGSNPGPGILVNPKTFFLLLRKKIDVSIYILNRNGLLNVVRWKVMSKSGMS